MIAELAYPFDSSTILSKGKRLKKRLLAEGTSFIDKNVAILGGSTTANVKDALELFLLDQGIRPTFYESEYNKYYEDAMFPNKELEEFAPDVIYIHTTSRNVTAWPKVSDTTEQIDQLLTSELGKFEAIWDRLANLYHAPIIQNNFEWPLYRLMGNKDASDIHGAVNFATRLNMEFYAYAQTHEDFFICDINWLAADYGLQAWHDMKCWYLYKYALGLGAIPNLAFNVANIIKSIFGKNKKGFVLDLDNTLWGGIVGDDGVEGIEIGQETATAEAYLEFQKYLKAHKDLGIILNIDSKNEHENAIAGLNHPESALSPDDFIEIKANWDPKDRNFVQIASALSLLPESLVFVDDNPAERHIVREQLKGVAAPEIGEVSDYIHVIDRAGFFEVTTLSKDDLKRNAMYKENAERARLEAAFENYSDYLRSLEMKAEIKAFDPIYHARIAQLSNKSNQFNLTTHRYTQPEIEAISSDDEYITLYGKLEDRFGDNGVVSVVIGHIVNSECEIDLWIMSCRVLKRDLEYAMEDALVDACKKRGLQAIRGFYYPTAKNGMVRDFYGDLGFEKVSEDAEGNSEWVLDITAPYENKNHVIAVADSSANPS